jgi:divalent metal cation (Fe/Co/Zn/Cd) transporter
VSSVAIAATGAPGSLVGTSPSEDACTTSSSKPRPPEHLRAGVRVSAASIVWTVASGVAAVALGLGAKSLVLVAFGLTGLLDAAASATLVAHFRHALRHEAFSDRHERRALRAVTAGLVVIGAFTAVESTRRLMDREPTHAVPAGVALAAMSVGALAVLSVRKRRIASRIPSRALLADGWLSATGCLLGVVTVTGTGLASAFQWWWADPVAALAVACVAVAIAVVMVRGSDRPRAAPLDTIG